MVKVTQILVVYEGNLSRTYGNRDRDRYHLAAWRASRPCILVVGILYQEIPKKKRKKRGSRYAVNFKRLQVVRPDSKLSKDPRNFVLNEFMNFNRHSANYIKLYLYPYVPIGYQLKYYLTFNMWL